MDTLRNSLRNMLLESAGGKAAGVLIMAEDTNKVMLMKRGWAPHKGHWSLLSGGMEDGEDKLTCLKREIMEEIQIDADEKLDLTFIRTEEFSKHTFHYYEGLTKTEFIPTLDDENEEYGWFSADDLPSPLYPELKEKVDELCKKKTKE